MIPIAEPSITDKEIAYVLDAVKSGWVSSTGPYVRQFEQKFAEYIGTRYALAVSNGTNALHLALASLGLRPGDEVIVPDLTFIATANAVVYTGAKPVFADIEPDTWCMDPLSVNRKITSKTKVILPVHLYGHPARMDEILKLGSEHGLYVVEDAAEAHGAEYKGNKVGSIGDVGIFSMYGNKIMTTGEGGMLTTNNPEIYEKAKHLRDHAMSKENKYYHTEIGYNYRLTNLQAALGLAQLERIKALIQRRRQIFDWYSSFLSKIESIQLNQQQSWAKNVVWMTCLLCNGQNGSLRDDIMQELRVQGVDTRPFFYPVSSQPMYGGRCTNAVAAYVSRRGLNLPSGPSLTHETVEQISKFVIEVVQKESHHTTGVSGIPCAELT